MDYPLGCRAEAVAKILVVNSLRANNSRHERLASSVVLGALDPPIAAKSYHILDIHARVASEPSREITSNGIRTFVLVAIPEYDPPATIVWSMTEPDMHCYHAGSVSGAEVSRYRVSQ